MLLVRCPWCGPRDEIEFRYGGQARADVSDGSRGAVGRGVGRLPLHARQPERAVPGTLVPLGGMPAMVQRRAGHGDPPVRRDVPARRGAAGVTGRRLPDGGTWIDRSRPIGFTFDGRELTGFEGDTLASALLANGVDVVCRSPILGRPRGVVSSGVEESSAFVEVSEPWFEPIVAATMVNLVDGLVARGRPGVGVLPVDPPGTKPSVHRHAHVEVLVVGSGDGWLPAVEEAVGSRRPGPLGRTRAAARERGAGRRDDPDQTPQRSASTTTGTRSCTSADPNATRCGTCAPVA